MGLTRSEICKGEFAAKAATAAATGEDVQAGGENGGGIKQLLVLHKGFPLGAEVTLPPAAVLVVGQILLALQRLTDAQDLLVVLQHGGQRRAASRVG